jgi:hypothetical protein
MKIAIIIPNLMESAPYVKNFTDVFDSIGADYEFICWDRNQVLTQPIKSEKMIVFKRSGHESNHLLRKLYDYYMFSRFVVKSLKSKRYDYLTVHTIVCSIFLDKFIRKAYKGRYIFDIRDYSPIYPYVKNNVRKLISSSSFTIISSDEYKRWLPKDKDYVLGHNVRKQDLESSFYKNDFNVNKYFTILTIGQIRDFSSNSRIIDSFGNKHNFIVKFAGSGLDKENLELYSRDRYSNIHFTGRYNKEEEGNLVKNSDFINIVLPTTAFAMTQMTNRFYLSLIYKKPMIVNYESIQAKFVEKYSLGIVVNSSEDIHDKLMQYSKVFDIQVFDKGCEDMLKIITQDIDNFENEIIRHFI